MGVGGRKEGENGINSGIDALLAAFPPLFINGRAFDKGVQSL